MIGPARNRSCCTADALLRPCVAPLVSTRVCYTIAHALKPLLFDTLGRVPTRLSPEVQRVSMFQDTHTYEEWLRFTWTHLHKISRAPGKLHGGCGRPNLETPTKVCTGPDLLIRELATGILASMRSTIRHLLSMDDIELR